MKEYICACCGKKPLKAGDNKPETSSLKTNLKFYLCDECCAEERMIIANVGDDDLPERVDAYYRVYKNNGIRPMQRI